MNDELKQKLIAAFTAKGQSDADARAFVEQDYLGVYNDDAEAARDWMVHKGYICIPSAWRHLEEAIDYHAMVDALDDAGVFDKGELDGEMHYFDTSKKECVGWIKKAV